MRTFLRRTANWTRATPPIGIAAPLLVKRLLRNRNPPRFVVDHLYRVGGTVQARLPDGHPILLECRGDELEPSQVFWRTLAGHQPEALLFWAFAREARAVVDVGAHLGIYTLAAAAANPAARVVALEPMPAVSARLIRNVRLNHLSNVEIVTSAASSSDGPRAFWFSPDVAAPSSSGLEATFFVDTKTECIVVHTARLDTLLSGLNPPLAFVDLVKIDVESHEPAVISGMGRLLESRPSLFVEILPWTDSAAALEDLLSDRGYRYFALSQGYPVEVERLGGKPAVSNYLVTTHTTAAVRSLWSYATRFRQYSLGSTKLSLPEDEWASG